MILTLLSTFSLTEILFDFKALLISIIASLVIILLNTLYKKKIRSSYKESRFVSIYEDNKYLNFLTKLLTISFVVYITTVSLLSSNVINAKKHEYSNRLVVINRNIADLRAKFEGIFHQDIKYEDLLISEHILLNEIRSESIELAEKIENVNDYYLSDKYKLFKYDNLAYIYLLSAQIESNEDKQSTFINKGLESCESAFFNYEQILRKMPGVMDKSSEALKNWLREDNVENRLHTVKLTLLAIKAYADKKITNSEKSAIMTEFGKIDTNYLNKITHVFVRNPFLNKLNLVPNPN